MKIRRTAFAAAIVAIVLVVLSGCYWDINWYVPGGSDPDPEPEPGPEPGIYFSLEWTENGTDDPHLYVTYPAPADGDTADDYYGLFGESPEFLEPYIQNVWVTDDDGFEPLDLTAGVPNEFSDERGAVHVGYQESARNVSGQSFEDPALEFVASEDGREEIIMRDLPFQSSVPTYDTMAISGDLTGLATGNYAWVGVMEVYAYASGGQLAYEGSSTSVGAVLTVYEVEADGDEVVLGVYEVPGNTEVFGASLVRINCFYRSDGAVIYQFNPDVRVLRSTTQIRSVAE